MNNKSLDELKEFESNLKQTYNSGTVLPFNIVYKNVVYNFKPEWQIYYDCNNQKIKGKYPLGYSTLYNYEGNTDELDFTFIKSIDGIEVSVKNIKKIKINMANIRNTIIKSKIQIDYDLYLNCNIIEAVNGLSIFLEKNHQTINTINFINVNDEIFKKMLLRECRYFKEDNIEFNKIKQKIKRKN